MKITVKNKPHYIVASTEFVYEEFDCHSTDGHTTAQGRRGWVENYNEELFNSYSSQNFIWTVKSRR